MSLARATVIFAVAGAATLGAGVLLERSGERIATHIGLSGVVFGATLLAGATSLPELSTGIRSVRLGDYQLAVSDIFGGNAFLPVLFLLASLLSGSAVLPQAQSTDIYLTALAIVLTVVYAWGLIIRPRRRSAHGHRFAGRAGPVRRRNLRALCGGEPLTPAPCEPAIVEHFFASKAALLWSREAASYAREAEVDAAPVFEAAAPAHCATAPAKNAVLEVSAAAYCARVLPMSSSCFGGLK